MKRKGGYLVLNVKEDDVYIKAKETKSAVLIAGIGDYNDIFATPCIIDNTVVLTAIIEGNKAIKVVINEDNTYTYEVSEIGTGGGGGGTTIPTISFEDSSYNDWAQYIGKLVHVTDCNIVIDGNAYDDVYGIVNGYNINTIFTCVEYITETRYNIVTIEKSNRTAYSTTQSSPSVATIVTLQSSNETIEVDGFGSYVDLIAKGCSFSINGWLGTTMNESLLLRASYNMYSSSPTPLKFLINDDTYIIPEVSNCSLVYVTSGSVGYITIDEVYKWVDGAPDFSSRYRALLEIGVYDNTCQLKLYN